MGDFSAKVGSFVTALCMAAAPAIATPAWQVGTSTDSPTAQLSGHKNLSSLTLACLASGQIGMTIKLAPKTPAPAKGKPVHIDLLSYFGNRGEAILPPTNNVREYSGPIDAKLVDTLMSRASPASDYAGGDSRVLALAISDDGGYSWLTGEPVTLVGAQPAVRALRDDCATRTGVDAKGFGSDEAELREAIFNMYQVYRSSSKVKPSGVVHMPYSMELQRYIDHATGNNGLLEHDPICQCQDYDEKAFYMRIVSLVMQQNRATAKIDVAASGFVGEPSPITMNFVKSQAGTWAVDDIIDLNGSLKNAAKIAKPGSWSIQ